MVRLSRKERKSVSGSLKKKQLQLRKAQTEENGEKAPEKVRRARTEKGILGLYKTKYKVLLIIPFIIILLAIAQITFQTITTGDFINKGVSLRGGVTLTVLGSFNVDPNDIESFISLGIGDDVAVRLLKTAGKSSGLIIDGPINTEKEILALVQQKIGTMTKDKYTIEETGSSLGQSFFRETAMALVMAFVMMGIVVFLYFRLLVPSAAVIFAALSDIIVTISIVNILGVNLSTGGIAAFLMLIGYSVDTDILLSTRVLKNKAGTVFSRVMDAMKTGITMSVTTLGAVTVGFFLSQSETLSQIMLILIIGLLVDLIFTWLQNAGLLRLYLEKVKRER